MDRGCVLQYLKANHGTEAKVDSAHFVSLLSSFPDPSSPLGYQCFCAIFTLSLPSSPATVKCCCIVTFMRPPYVARMPRFGYSIDVRRMSLVVHTRNVVAYESLSGQAPGLTQEPRATRMYASSATRVFNRDAYMHPFRCDDPVIRGHIIIFSSFLNFFLSVKTQMSDSFAYSCLRWYILTHADHPR